MHRDQLRSFVLPKVTLKIQATYKANNPIRQNLHNVRRGDKAIAKKLGTIFTKPRTFAKNMLRCLSYHFAIPTLIRVRKTPVA